jgi:hypothetical protein
LRENADHVARSKAEQTRKLQHLYREAIRAWEASKAQRTRRRQRKTDVAVGAGGGTVAEVVMDDSHGDPRYLDAARRTVADLTRLWKVDGAADGAGGEDEAPMVFTFPLGDARLRPADATTERTRGKRTCARPARGR